MHAIGNKQLRTMQATCGMATCERKHASNMRDGNVRRIALKRKPKKKLK
jgi:hypothetical protein